MLSDFGGGFNAPRTPMMSQGDEDSVDESKMPDLSMVDTGVSGGNDPHGDHSCGGVTHIVTQIQRGDDDIQDWDAKVLNHMLVNVLDKDWVDFMAFVIANGMEDDRLLLTMLEDDYKSIGHNIHFKTFRTSQTVNKMCNEQILDTVSEDDKNMWFFNLNKQFVMHCMMHDTKVTTAPSARQFSTNSPSLALTPPIGS